MLLASVDALGVARSVVRQERPTPGHRRKEANAARPVQVRCSLLFLLAAVVALVSVPLSGGASSQRRPSPAPQVHAVTLITGDVVRLVTRPDGTHGVSLEPGLDGTVPRAAITETTGHLYVIPHAASRLLAAKPDVAAPGVAIAAARAAGTALGLPWTTSTPSSRGPRWRRRTSRASPRSSTATSGARRSRFSWRSQDGASAPPPGVTLSASQVTVPAGGRVAVDVVLDPGEAALGAHSGVVVARAAGTEIRTSLGFELETERYDRNLPLLVVDYDLPLSSTSTAPAGTAYAFDVRVGMPPRVEVAGLTKLRVELSCVAK
jgi:hypothetical protein